MKKIYLAILSVITFTQVSNAQLTLTKAFNEPVIGDNYPTQRYDSTGVLDNSFGPNTLWDFSTLATNTAVAQSNYTTVASTPSASSYPNATFAEDLGNGGYNYWKSTATPTTQLELLGIIQPSISFNLNANSAIAFIWPIAYGYNKTDAFSGSVAVQTPTANLTGTATGNIKTLGSGSGTVVLPGGLTFTNVLQVTSTQTINASLSLGPFPVGTATITSTNFQYFHSTQKFPVISVNYQIISGSFTGTTTVIRVNNKVFVGIDEATQNFNYSLYPNPATTNLNIAFTNNKAETVSVKIINNLGQLVKTVELGNSIDIEKQIDLSTLNSGIYFVKTIVGNLSSTKKLIKE